MSVGLRAEYAFFVFQNTENKKTQTNNSQSTCTNKPKQVKQEKHEETSLVVHVAKIPSSQCRRLGFHPWSGS